MPKNLTDDVILKERLTVLEYQSLAQARSYVTESIKNDKNPLLHAIRGHLTPLCIPLGSSFREGSSTVKPTITMLMPASHVNALSLVLTNIKKVTQASRFTITPVLNLTYGNAWMIAPNEVPGWLNIELQFGIFYYAGDLCLPDPDDVQYLANLWSQSCDIVGMAGHQAQ